MGFGFEAVSNLNTQEALALLKKKGGDPAAPSSTATLLRLHSSH
uniref:Uncharacterized protein n=1 Tax=Brassica campestris TaxID=3711 RepID=A0A3P6DZT1_BRACM|nr:unnamed protein product [Brassica rapa]